MNVDPGTPKQPETRRPLTTPIRIAGVILILTLGFWFSSFFYNPWHSWGNSRIATGYDLFLARGLIVFRQSSGVKTINLQPGSYAYSKQEHEPFEFAGKHVFRMQSRSRDDNAIYGREIEIQISLWWILLPLLAVLVYLIRARPYVLSDPNRSCPTCGYDLRATPERCPECGTIPKPGEARRT